MADNRYNDAGVIDSVISTQGDEQIIGMDARTQPERLAPGMGQYLQNMRLDTLAPTVRKGMAKQTNAIQPVSVPLFIPFTVGTSSVIGGAATDGVFTSCVFSDPNNSNALYIFLATAQKCYTFASSNSAVTTIAYPANEIVEPTDTPDMFQVGGKVYLVRGELGVVIGVSSLTSSSALSATMVTTAAHGLQTNNYVRIGGATQTAYNGDFQVTVTNSTTFTYTMASAPSASPATGTIALNRLKTPFVWDGNFSDAFTLNGYGQISGNFYHMPASNWGLLQQNRVIMEYNRTAVIMSGINNADSYDIINGVFNFAVGTNDYLVGAAPYQNTQTLIFMRQSVWMINYINGDVANMTTQLITNQVGCCSRHTIATCGANVLFLNERGVFQLEPGLELALRGNSLPLSAPIDPFIKTINFSAINKAWAVYYLNRYYLAVPVNGATRNNAMFVYNFINQNWESYDTFPNGFFCDEMQVMLNASGIPTLYNIMYEGGLYAAEQNQQDDFAAAAQPATQYLINGQFKTRRFNFGNSGLKRFNRVITVASMSGSSTLTATATTINPEDTKTLASITNSNGTSGQTTRPQIINKRAYALEITYMNTSGTCQILNYQIGAYVQDLKSTMTN